MYGKKKVHHITRNAFRTDSKKWRNAEIKKSRRGTRGRIRNSLSQIVSEEEWDECYEDFREEKVWHNGKYYCGNFVAWAERRAKDVPAEKRIGYIKNIVHGNGKNVYFARQSLKHSNIMNPRFRPWALRYIDPRPILTRDEIKDILYNIVTDAWAHKQLNLLIRNRTTSVNWYKRYEYAEPSPYGGDIIKYKYLPKNKPGVSKHLAGAHDIEKFMDHYKRGTPIRIKGDGIHYCYDYSKYDNRWLANPNYQPGVRNAVMLFIEFFKDHSHDRKAISDLIMSLDWRGPNWLDYKPETGTKYKWEW
jgi:hypothetical protein